MIKAGALLYAIFISFILTLLTSIFLLISFYSNAFKYQLIKVSELSDNIESAINIYNVNPEAFSKNTTSTLNLFQDSESEVELKVKQWGLYSIIYLSTYWKNIKAEKIILNGQAVSSDDRVALYYTNSANKLTICGNTLIEGSVFTPNKTIERGYIEGKGYGREKLVQGNLYSAEKELPELNIEMVDIFNKFNLNNFEKGSIFDYQDFTEYKKVIKNSFKDKTIVLFSEESIFIEDIKFLGNIIIISNEDIQVSNTSSLSDIIIFADHINIESEFKGNLQIMAFGSINIGENCSLTNPSILYCKSNTLSNILIGAKSKIIGDVVLLSSESNSDSKIMVNHEGLIHGMVYTNGVFELHGGVSGSVYCNKIQLNTKSSSYSGYLLDCEINANKLSKNYITCNLFNQNKFEAIIKELE